MQLEFCNVHIGVVSMCDELHGYLVIARNVFGIGKQLQRGI